MGAHADVEVLSAFKTCYTGVPHVHGRERPLSVSRVRVCVT